MPHTLSQAAKAVGKDRTTILRAIKSGKLSAGRDELTGAWLIEPAELHRLYPPDTAHTLHATGNTMARQEPEPGEFRELRARLEAAEARLVDKDTVIVEQRSALDDLRRRLDTEAEERRRAQEQLAGLQTQMAALLTDQRPAPAVPASPPPAPRRW
jgi:hypothetical protein